MGHVTADPLLVFVVDSAFSVCDIKVKVCEVNIKKSLSSYLSSVVDQHICGVYFKKSLISHESVTLDFKAVFI